jgi:hypothetical protein
MKTFVRACAHLPNWGYLTVAYSTRFSQHPQAEVQRRLTAVLQQSGLSTVVQGSHLFIHCMGRPIHPGDVAKIVDWLIQQPEVLVVCRSTQAELVAFDDQF